MHLRGLKGMVCAAAMTALMLFSVLFPAGTAYAESAARGPDYKSLKSEDISSYWNPAEAEFIDLDAGTCSGPGACFDGGSLHITDAGCYALSGTLSGGNIIIEAGKKDKVRLVLNGAEISCDTAPAIVAESAKKLIITLADGTVNTLVTGADQQGREDGAIYAHTNLSINGAGTLDITADYRHGMACTKDLAICGGSFVISSARDCVHANDSVHIREAELKLSAGHNGITVAGSDEDDYLYVESGTITIDTCYEGLEATTVAVAGGDIYVTPEDDGMNAFSLIDISGGNIRIENRFGIDADGLDSNMDIRISGGSLFISVSEYGKSTALDYGIENGGNCTISGGTVIACGSKTMLEPVSEDSPQPFITAVLTGAEGSELLLTDTSGTGVISETIPCGFTALILSSPELIFGEKYTLSIDGAATEVTADNSTPSSFPGGKTAKPPAGPGDGKEPPRMPDGEEPGGPGQEPPPPPEGEAHGGRNLTAVIYAISGLLLAAFIIALTVQKKRR